MAKNTIADLSVTPSNNTDLLSQNATGSADANTLDTLIQNVTGILARAYGDQGGLGTVGGSASAITLTSLSTYQELKAGMQIAIKASAPNPGAATLNLDSLGAKKIRRRGDTALSPGDMAATGRYTLQFDAGYDAGAGAWVLMTPEITADLLPYVLLATEDQVITGGARVTPKDLGNLSGASITPDTGDRPIQKVTNNGAGSILPGSNTGQYTLQVLNTAGAGAITTTGWTLKGDPFDTSTNSKFLCSCLVTADLKVMTVLKVAP